MEERVFVYRTDVLQQLAAHGIIPRPHSPPDLVRGYVRELYKHEIRTLRGRLLRREFPKDQYAARVDALRRQYPVLALTAAQFLEVESTDRRGPG